MCVGLHVNYPLFLSDFLEFSRQIFPKYSNTRFHENSSSGSRVIPCGRTDGWADMKTLTVVFRSLRTRLKTGFERTKSNKEANFSTNVLSEILIFNSSEFRVFETICHMPSCLKFNVSSPVSPPPY